MKPKSFQLRFDEAEHKRLKVFCAEHGMSMQEFITKAVDEYRKKWAV